MNAEETSVEPKGISRLGRRTAELCDQALVPFAKEEELENLVKTEQLPLSSVEAEPIGHDSDGEATLKGKKSEA
ncbi:UNVERIFIED_CONTAM: hypothetical protein K2H54_061670 [Gekko kuhli]